MFLKEVASINCANRAIDTQCLLVLQQLVHIFITGHETVKYFRIICCIAVQLTATWRVHCKFNVITAENEDRILQDTLRYKSLFYRLAINAEKVERQTVFPVFWEQQNNPNRKQFMMMITLL